MAIPLAYIASESGWLVAEFGRQPWTIQDMLPVSASVSEVGAGSVALTFFIFLGLFTTMLAVELSIMFKEIKKGPEHPVSNTYDYIFFFTALLVVPGVVAGSTPGLSDVCSGSKLHVV